MVAKPRRPAASAPHASSSSSSTAAGAATTTSLGPVRKPTPSSTSTSTSTSTFTAVAAALSPSHFASGTKDEPGPAPSMFVTHSNADHRPNQPFAGAAPLRPVQLSPSLNNHGRANQSSYPVQGYYNPQTGLHSPYLNNAAQFHPQQQNPSDNQYHNPNPSPRSTNSVAYYPSDKHDAMAAATATMQRPPYPPIYHTPQSNSPVSVTSPQSHDQVRPMYQPAPQLTPTMYGYQPYHHPSAYGGHHNPNPIGSQSMMPYPQTPHTMSHAQMPSQPANMQSSPRIKGETGQQYAQPSVSQPNIMHRLPTAGAPPAPGLHSAQTSASGSTSNAAPGPIPATTPLVVRQDQNGVQWIAFEYSRDRVKMEYTIRCDVESVDASSLSQEFKSENCVYPRACVPKDQYKGNRLAYETDCNQVGWALAELNPCLRGKRGLIQRAVDSWRNSNQDPRLRSRRVRRQAKLNTRSKGGAPQTQTPGSAVTIPTGLSGSSQMSPPGTRPTGSLSQGPQSMHHHHNQSPSGQDQVTASVYSTTPNIHRPQSTNQSLNSPNDMRQAHSFPGYQTYPTVPTSLGPSMAPPIHGGMHHYGRGGGNATMARERAETDQESDLFGDVPENKKRKFIVVEDTREERKIRVKVTLDQVEISEVPDSYRKSNSVFPRAYYPVQMQTASESTNGSRFAEDDVEEIDDIPPIVGRMTVPCQTTDGDAEVEVSQLSRGKRSRERKVNELGYRMAWGQSRVFSNRPIFLGRALDAYRNQQRQTLAATDDAVVPAHLETRPGKRRWHERIRPQEDPESPTGQAPI